MDEGGGVDIIYLDYSEAFDCVPHKRLLSKLESYGVHEKVWTWVKDFLIGRRRQVSVGDAESDWTSVSSGVLQRSVLGSILFVAYINTLSDNVKSDVKMFAYDTKLYRYMHDEKDNNILRKDLNNLQTWSET